MDLGGCRLIDIIDCVDGDELEEFFSFYYPKALVVSGDELYLYCGETYSMISVGSKEDYSFWKNYIEEISW